MRRNNVLFAALAAALTIGTVAVAAEDGHQRLQQSGRRANHEDAAESAWALGARVAPADAAAAAERAANGRAAKLSMEAEHGTPVYEIKVVAGDRVLSVKIDPATGAVLETEREGLLARLFDAEDDDEVKAVLAAPTTLSQAITAAEHLAGGGRAVDATWEGERRMRGYAVEVVQAGGGIVRTFVDAASGQAHWASPKRGGER
ncbi:hypothetical protein E2C06_25920 [Dankookia rubra]|uniref:PepSY domain-containing protein n=1 Tax=Dankookia rubra TaxID=1442381 RepID=A0A4R5Q9P1_9PROT|nr:PepSY domain-containing protein [Dankookia rubra]TDH59722.1 hypothetical protein E2C06_25920 [Dankookia rubra]